MTKPPTNALYIDTSSEPAYVSDSRIAEAWYGCNVCAHVSQAVGDVDGGANAEARARALATLHDCEDEDNADAKRSGAQFGFADWLDANRGPIDPPGARRVVCCDQSWSMVAFGEHNAQHGQTTLGLAVGFALFAGVAIMASQAAIVAKLQPVIDALAVGS